MEKSFKMSLASVIFTMGQKFRNPSLQKWFHFLKQSEKWSLDTLEAYQLEKLQELVQVAYQNSSFYKKKWDKAYFHPSEIKQLSDLKKIPITTKNELIENSKTNTTNIHFKRAFKATTSGTSGNALQFLREESADSFNRAAIFRGYSWYNVKPWELNGYLWGFNFSFIEKAKTRVLDGFQNRFRLFEYQENKVAKFLKKLEKATYLHGYSSMIYELAKKVNEKQYGKPLQLKMVKGTSEKIFDSYKNEVEKAFGTKIISEYGAAETGIIAFECQHGNMHITMEGVIVEEIENEIVVTNLQMLSFPVIRYKLGDYIKLRANNNVCECGMHHSVIEEVTGRIGKNVYGKKQVYPSLYFYYVFKNLGKQHELLLNYQVHQHKKGNLLVLIEQILTDNEKKLVADEMKVYFKEDVDFEILDNQKIKTTNKKQQSFISKIDV